MCRDDDMTTSSMDMYVSVSCFSNVYNYAMDTYNDMVRWDNIRSHRAFIRSLAKMCLEPNPLHILARAVNALDLHCRVIFQPRWKHGRWKAKT